MQHLSAIDKLENDIRIAGNEISGMGMPPVVVFIRGGSTGSKGHR